MLKPSASVTLGNLRYDSHAVSLEACLGLLPRGGSATVHLPASVRFEARAGDEAHVDIDGGEGVERVLTGTVRQVTRTPSAILVHVEDAAGRLASYRPCTTYERQGAAQVVRGLGSDLSIPVGRVDLDLDLAAYVAHPQMTAAEHIASLCRLGGALGRVAGDGNLEIIRRPSGRPDKALRYGREFMEYRATNAPVPNASRFAMGFGPAGSPSAPDAMKQTTDALPGSARQGGEGVRRIAFPMLRTASAASNASTALQEATAASGQRLEARCFMLPGLRPGDVVEVQSLPDALSGGPWLLTRVTHRLAPDTGGLTVIEAEGADTASLLGSLVGAALAAVGGLL